MWLLEQDHSLASYGIRRRLDLIKQMDRMSKKNLLYTVNSVGETKYNTAYLEEEVDLMEMDRKPNLILLGKK